MLTAVGGDPIETVVLDENPRLALPWSDRGATAPRRRAPESPARASVSRTQGGGRAGRRTTVAAVLGERRRLRDHPDRADRRDGNTQPRPPSHPVSPESHRPRIRHEAPVGGCCRKRV